MQALERPTFDTAAAKDIYEYVERHGTAARHTVRDVVSLPPEQFRAQLDLLKEKGYLEEEGGTIKLALDVGAVEEYETDDISVTVRPSRQTDFDDLVTTIRDVTDEQSYVIAESVAEQLLYEDTVTRHNTVESRVFFVASVDGEVVGWTHLDVPQVEKLGDTAQQTVGVRGEYQGHGIGGLLLQRGLDWAEANGFRKVYESVPATNEDAMVFLEAYGWDTEAIRKNHYTIDGELVDEVMMAHTF